MASDPATRAFLRFRDGGDPEELAAVFDAVAPRLLLVAAHVARDAAEAEDLVQTTFLDALRDARRFDGSRPVAAWLAGILRHRALDARRRAGVRRAEEAADAASPAGDPAAIAAEREVLARVRDAALALEEPYRSVLVLRLVHGLRPTEIAHALGRRPGTVRMQLERGLERLRRALPERAALAGVAWLDGALARTLEGAREPVRGLDAVREAVVAKAAAAAAQAAPVAATTALAAGVASLGGGIMATKLLLGLALAAGIALTLHALRGGEPRVEPASAVAAAAAGAPAADAPPRAPAAPASALAAAPASASRTAASAAPAPAPAATTPEPFVVRVLRAPERSPVADVGVYLRPRDAGVGTARRTDAAGSARFEGLAPGEYEAHVDRLDAPTAVEVEPGGAAEIVLPAGLAVTGRVVDLAGAPVAGARVLRLAPGHHELLQELARTDEQGRFALADAAPGIRLLARAPRHQRSELATVREGHEVELVLGARGHALAGRVVDADGASVPFAAVALCVDEDAREDPEGSRVVPAESRRRKPLDLEASFLRADEAGRFTTDEVPAGHVLVLARPLDPASPLVGHAALWVRGDVAEELVVRLAPGAEVTGVVRDERGAPVAGAELEAEWEGSAELGQLEDEIGPWASDRRAEAGADGAYRLVGLLAGDHDLRVLGMRGEGAFDERELAAGERARWDPVVDAEARLRVRLEGPSGAPLAGWIVAASEHAGRLPGWKALEARTDAEGRFALEVPAGRPLQVSVYPPPDPLLQVPLAVRDGVLAPAAPEDELVVRLRPEELPTARLAGLLVDAAGAPLAGVSMALGVEGWQERLWARSGPDGRFAFEGLAAREYELLVRLDPRGPERPLGRHALAPGEELDVGVVGP